MTIHDHAHKARVELQQAEVRLDDARAEALIAVRRIATMLDTYKRSAFDMRIVREANNRLDQCHARNMEREHAADWLKQVESLAKQEETP